MKKKTHTIHATPGRLPEIFHAFARRSSAVVGSPWMFVLAVLVIITWAASGRMFGWSDTWQLVINTSTTIVTFLIVILIQNTQNRDSQAMHLKLDELIHALKGARSIFIELEEMSEEELKKLEEEFGRLRKKRVSASKKP